jgi:DNA polymerase-3 subunit gamma/tau
MEQFVVSARKYRPITFDSVVGQGHITTTLRNAIKTEHLAQAFLFCGPRGVGKTTCARILAKTINCQNVSADTEPCNECTSCKNFSQNASFNIHELDAASNNSVEDIRNLIDQVRFPPQDGKYKVYIIDEVHMLSPAAFNAFLKTLEEPPSYAIFILATTEKHKILPTILSRCQIFDFNRIQIKDMADHLASIAKMEGIETEPEALELIAQKADGGLRDALSMFDLNVTFSTDKLLTYAEVLENLHVLDYDYYFRMTDALHGGDLSEALLIFNEILEKGFDGHQFVTGLNGHFRNLLVGKDARTVDLMEVSSSVKNKYLEQTKKVTQGYLMSALSVGSQVDLSYKSAKNQRLHVEIGLMKMASISQVLNLASLPANNDEAEKKNSTDVGSAKEVQNNVPIAAASVVAKQENLPTIEPTAVSSLKPKFKSSKLRSTVDLEVEVQASNQVLETETKAAEQVMENKPFDLKGMEEALLACGKTMETQSQSLILKSGFELDGNQVTLKLVNQTLMDLFDELKQDILDFVRKKLQNSDIQLNSILVAAKNEGKPRTEQEKFKAMLEKNPALKNFKDELGLDLVY